MGKRKICSVGGSVVDTLEERSRDRLRGKRRFVISVSEDESEAAASRKFMSIVTDDLLLEIFIRLPYARYLIQQSTVCKRWLSLLSDPLFTRRFNQFHSHELSHSPPHTILIRYSHSDRRIYEVFSEKSKILFGARSIEGHHLDFMTDPLGVKGSFQDVLLTSRFYHAYSIYNPLTRQRVPLPPAPNKGLQEICGLLGGLKDSQFCYKVLLIVRAIKYEDQYRLDAAVFSSDTGKWCQSILSFPRTLAPMFDFWGECVASNGILYCFLRGGGGEWLRGLAAFHLSNGTGSSSSTDNEPIRIRFIHLPVGFGRGWRASPDRVYHGVVQGSLRLSQLIKKKGNFVLKVWELNPNNNVNNNKDDDDDLEWLLVHEVTVKRNGTNRMFVVGFHPNKGDVIFMFCDCVLYKYKIGQGEYKKIGQLPDGKFSKDMLDQLTSYMTSFTLVHPSLPTLIPTIPSV